MSPFNRVIKELFTPFPATDLSRVIRNCIILLSVLTISVFFSFSIFVDCKWLYASMTFLVVAIGCFAFGSAIGFLFSVPKVHKEYKNDSPYQDNTALEDIADWLTKIILGLTLVEIRKVLELLNTTANNIESALLGCCEVCPRGSFYVFAYAAVAIYFLAGGGIAYLWTRTNLALIFTNSMMAAKDRAIEDLKKERQNILIKTQMSEGSTESKETAAVVETDEPTTGLQVPTAEFRSEVVSKYRSRKVLDTEDLQRGRWGGKSERGGFILEALYNPNLSQGRLHGVTLHVRCIGDKNWSGQVAFLLHDTFQPEIGFARAASGQAEWYITAFEAFVVAAVVEDGPELELDLNAVVGFPKDFYYVP